MIKEIGLILMSIWLITLPNFFLAKSIPRGSRYDARMKSQSYNEQDITLIKIALGRVSSLIFSEDEIIESAFVGFGDGWELVTAKNILYLKPIFPKNQSETGFNSANLLKNKYWNTNLLVKTNKNFYAFDLETVAENSNESAFVVKFNYPQEIAKKRKEAQILLAKKKEKEAVKKLLNNLTIPRNWNYRAKVASNSEIIAPVFVYDDGTNTYLGFTKEKSIPSVFLQNDGKEMLVNSLIKNYNKKYKLLVVNKTHPVMVLRSGDKVVGIFNNGFGKNIGKYRDTTSENVDRVINER